MLPQKNGLNDLIGFLSTPAPKGSPLELLSMAIAGIEAADYLCRKLDQYEKEQRFDDNLHKLLEQASRLYESGQISKAQFKAILDQLPETVETQAKPVEESPQINEILKNVDPAKLAQLLGMLK